MIILASQSPYRKRLLERLHLTFQCVPSDLDESPWHQKKIPAADMATQLAMAKAKHVLGSFPNDIIIGADQVVHLKGVSLTKPGTPEKAFEQLMSLSGQTHELVTATAVLFGGRTFQILDRSRISLRRLEEAEAKRYIEIDQPWDCVGSIKFEALGVSLVEKIETQDPSAIEGLPLIGLSNVLRQLGVHVP